MDQQHEEPAERNETQTPVCFLQRVASTCLFIASKVEEVSHTERSLATAGPALCCCIQLERPPAPPFYEG
jgi:hypothetical protein